MVINHTENFIYL